MKTLIVLLLSFYSCTFVLGQSSNIPLPFFKDKFASDSVQLPLPIGAGGAFLAMKQHYAMTDLKLNGNSIDYFTVNKSQGTDVILMPRIDAWVLPFLNVYAFAGVIDGQLDMNVHVLDKDLPEIEFDLPLLFKYTGAYYGLGTSVVLSQNHVFTMIDGNYAKAKLDNLNSELIMYMTTARFGYISHKKNNTMIWIGTMYQDVNQTLSQMSDGDEIQATVNVKEPMNLLIGARYNIKRFGFVAEMGGLGRSQLILSAEVRF